MVGDYGLQIMCRQHLTCAYSLSKALNTISVCSKDWGSEQACSAQSNALGSRFGSAGKACPYISRPFERKYAVDVLLIFLNIRRSSRRLLYRCSHQAALICRPILQQRKADTLSAGTCTLTATEYNQSNQVSTQSSGCTGGGPSQFLHAGVAAHSTSNGDCRLDHKVGTSDRASSKWKSRRILQRAK